MSTTVFHDAMFDGDTLEVTWGGGSKIVLSIVDQGNTVNGQVVLDAKTATNLSSQLLQFASQNRES